MQLPQDYKLSVGNLSATFKNRSASYKFYWFLSILEALEDSKFQEDKIVKKEIFARMIANAWYTVNYFQVSFGAQDNIQKAIRQIKKEEGIDIDEDKNEILNRLLDSSSKLTTKLLKHFDKQVPHYFLSPWIGSKGTKNVLSEISRHGKNHPPYALYDDLILIQPDWMDYFKRNTGILKDFCYWHLTLFLQMKNPNVPDIPNKLVRPEKRGSLSKHKSEFWDIVIERLGHVNCIYTGEPLIKGTYAVEHFIPFQFVAHDQMWNLIPANPSFNSSKGAKLPPLEKYFNAFYKTQEAAVNIVKEVKPKNTFLEHYLRVFPNLEFNEKQYKECIEPMLMIAHNNGFEYMKEK